MSAENTEAQSHGDASANLLFVVGIFRSGTSLCYALLNRHTQIALMYEGEILDFPPALTWARLTHDWVRRQEFFNFALSRHRLCSDQDGVEVNSIRTPDDLYRVLGDKKRSAFYGDKSIAYCARLRSLSESHPGCSFVLLWRDPIEIYRSVVRAARTERVFRRFGMLSRLVYYQEQMIRQSAYFARAGVRVCHISYAELAENSELVCRRVCSFLGIEFQEQMLAIAEADLSAIPPGTHHENLRSGTIQRRRFGDEDDILNQRTLRKLWRWNARWRRLRHPSLAEEATISVEGEPSAFERLRSNSAGWFFVVVIDNAKRLLFEFLPLPWLRWYRWIKSNFFKDSYPYALKS